MPTVHILDYVAGNVRSLANAVERLGFTVEWVKEPCDISKAEVSTSLKLSSTAWCKVLRRGDPDFSVIVLDPAGCWPFWSLPDSIRSKWLSRFYPRACRLW